MFFVFPGRESTQERLGYFQLSPLFKSEAPSVRKPKPNQSKTKTLGQRFCRELSLKILEPAQTRSDRTVEGVAFIICGKGRIPVGKPSAKRFPRCCVYCFLLWSCDSSICLHFFLHCLLTTLPNSPFSVYIRKDRRLALWEKDLPIREDYILLYVLLILGVSWTLPPANKADWLSSSHRTSDHPLWRYFHSTAKIQSLSYAN